jgi:hypothetical protein
MKVLRKIAAKTLLDRLRSGEIRRYVKQKKLIPE